MANSLRAIVLLFFGVGFLGFFVWALFVKLPSKIDTPPTVVAIRYELLSFADLKGWPDDDVGAALPALLRSCDKVSKTSASKSLSGHKFPGTDVFVSGSGEDWKEICAAAALVDVSNPPASHVFFENWFTPFEVIGEKQSERLFTGYYEPVIKGSREKSEQFNVALLTKPEDLVHVELGGFRPHLKGERIAGRVVGGRLKPFESRAQIEAGDLQGVDALVFLESSVDAFFTQIQGSARVELDDGSSMRVNYAGQNGHPYTAIGGPLIRSGEIPREEMSMQAIRTWLETHVDEAQNLMNQNASYIFFREVKIDDPGLGPIGAQNLPLTAGRSIAIDRKYHALGLPFWVDTSEPVEGTAPQADKEDVPPPTKPLKRLMIAQDTGGAIRGPARADIFFGTGPEAATRAGPMKQPGRLVVFVPTVAAQAYDRSLEVAKEVAE